MIATSPTGPPSPAGPARRTGSSPGLRAPIDGELPRAKLRFRSRRSRAVVSTRGGVRPSVAVLLALLWAALLFAAAAAGTGATAALLIPVGVLAALSAARAEPAARSAVHVRVRPGWP